MDCGLISCQVLGGVGTASAAVFAAFSALFAGISLRSDAKSRDVSSYLDILSRFQESERKIDQASDRQQIHFIIKEHINFLEGIACLCNKKKFGSATKELCHDALVNHLAVFENNDITRELLENSVTNSETYEYLLKFYQKNRQSIKDRVSSIKLSEQASLNKSASR
jgi:hypothetical protein